MHFSAALVLTTYVLAISVFAIGVSAGGRGVSGDDPAQPRISRNLKVANKGSIRYVKGFDITGVVTEADLTFPQVKTASDCIQECLNCATTCAWWVYKISTPPSAQSGHRTCTLYIQLDLPADETIEIDLSSELNQNFNAAKITANGNQIQAGSLVPEAFKDTDLNTMPEQGFLELGLATQQWPGSLLS